MSFPAMLWTAPGFSLSPMEALTLFQANSIFIWTSFALLLWDWVSFINKEVELVWTVSSCDKTLGRKLSAEGSGQTLKRSWYTPTYITTKITFLISRYLAVAQGITVVTLFTLGDYNPSACDLTRFLSFGFTIVSFSTHLVMILKLYGLFGRSRKVLIGLSTLALVDFVISLLGSSLLQPIFFELGIESAHSCFYIPSTDLFALAFLSPTIFHHVILAMTLFKSFQHLEAEKLVGQGSVMRVLRKDQLLYVLGICLINALNIILVFQNNSPAYKLINYFPSMVLTQIFLGRMFFTLRSFSQNRSPLSSSLQHHQENDCSFISPPTSSLSGQFPLSIYKQRPSLLHIDSFQKARVATESTTFTTPPFSDGVIGPSPTLISPSSPSAKSSWSSNHPAPLGFNVSVGITEESATEETMSDV